MWHVRFIIIRTVHFALTRDFETAELIRESLILSGAKDAKVFPFAEPPDDYKNGWPQENTPG